MSEVGNRDVIICITWQIALWSYLFCFICGHDSFTKIRRNSVADIWQRERTQKKEKYHRTELWNKERMVWCEDSFDLIILKAWFRPNLTLWLNRGTVYRLQRSGARINFFGEMQPDVTPQWPNRRSDWTNPSAVSLKCLWNGALSRWSSWTKLQF